MVQEAGYLAMLLEASIKMYFFIRGSIVTTNTAAAYPKIIFKRLRAFNYRLILSKRSQKALCQIRNGHNFAFNEVVTTTGWKFD